MKMTKSEIRKEIRWWQFQEDKLMDTRTKYTKGDLERATEKVAKYKRLLEEKK